MFRNIVFKLKLGSVSLDVFKDKISFKNDLTLLIRSSPNSFPQILCLVFSFLKNICPVINIVSYISLAYIYLPVYLPLQLCKQHSEQQ